MQSQELFKQNLLARIKTTVLITMLMITFMFERNFLCKSFPLLGVKWFVCLIGFFVLSSALLALTLFVYHLLAYKCSSCRKNWSKLQVDELVASTSKIKLLFLVFRNDLVLKTEKCISCENISSRKCRKVSIDGIANLL